MATNGASSARLSKSSFLLLAATGVLWLTSKSATWAQDLVFHQPWDDAVSAGGSCNLTWDSTPPYERYLTNFYLCWGFTGYAYADQWYLISGGVKGSTWPPPTPSGAGASVDVYFIENTNASPVLALSTNIFWHTINQFYWANGSLTYHPDHRVPGYCRPAVRVVIRPGSSWCYPAFEADSNLADDMTTEYLGIGVPVIDPFYALTTRRPFWMGTNGFNAFFSSVSATSYQVIEASSNLTAWTGVCTNKIPGTNFLFTDSFALTNRSCYYRVRQYPRY